MMTNTTPSAAFLIGRLMRDASTLPNAATFLASKLRGATPEFIAAVGDLAETLGADSHLVVTVAFAEATAAVGEAAGRCQVGSRRRRAHLARFEALCAAHDRFLAVEKARAL